MCSSVGLVGDNIVTAAGTQIVKDRLRYQSEEAIKLGVFGVPTTQVGNELFWGSELDTIAHIEDAISGQDRGPSQSELEKWIAVKPTANRRK